MSETVVGMSGKMMTMLLMLMLLALPKIRLLRLLRNLIADCMPIALQMGVVGALCAPRAALAPGGGVHGPTDGLNGAAPGGNSDGC